MTSRNLKVKQSLKRADNVTINVDKIEIGDGEVNIKPRELPEAPEGGSIEIEKPEKQSLLPTLPEDFESEEEPKKKSSLSRSASYTVEIYHTEEEADRDYGEDSKGEGWYYYGTASTPTLAEKYKAYLSQEGWKVRVLPVDYVEKAAKEDVMDESIEEEDIDFDYGDLIQLKKDPTKQGIFLETMDGKPGDIDILCYFFEPQAGYHVIEVPPTDIERVPSEPTDEQMEAAEVAYEAWEEEIEEYEEEGFKNKVEEAEEKIEEDKMKEEIAKHESDGQRGGPVKADEDFYGREAATDGGKVFDMSNVEEFVARLNSEIKAPVVKADFSTLGGRENVSIIVSVSLDPKETWTNGIFENSRYFHLHLDNSGSMEQFTRQGIPKMRKTRFNSFDDAIQKINSYISSVDSEGSVKTSRYRKLKAAPVMAPTSFQTKLKQAIKHLLPIAIDYYMDRRITPTDDQILNFITNEIKEKMGSYIPETEIEEVYYPAKEEFVRLGQDVSQKPNIEPPPGQKVVYDKSTSKWTVVPSTTPTVEVKSILRNLQVGDSITILGAQTGKEVEAPIITVDPYGVTAFFDGKVHELMFKEADMIDTTKFENKWVEMILDEADKAFFTAGAQPTEEDFIKYLQQSMQVEMPEMFVSEEDARELKERYDKESSFD